MASDDKNNRQEPSRARGPLYVAGVGASAGGLEALERLFSHMPTDSGIAFVVVQHLSPDFNSMMDELLGRRTKLPVRRVEDGMPVRPDHVYMIPPAKDMIISDGRLLLTDKDPNRELTLPVDVFLRSLAQDLGTRSIALILSGTGSDGSRGVSDVHNEGGLVIAQSPTSARFDGMPVNAVDTGVVDLVLAPEAMPDALVRYVTHLGGTPTAERPVVGRAAGLMDQVLDLLHGKFGIDFNSYKPNMVARRIERRLLLQDEEGLESYFERLQEDEDELNHLYRDLLIGVTRFFRDPTAFSVLEDRVLPDLVRRLSEDDELRVWVAGCATGEEAYSVAMLADEAVRRSGKGLSIKVFATDVHRRSLEFASVGLYPEAAVEEVGDARLERYFVKEGDEYRVSKELRQLVVFAPHNIVHDAPFTRLDLVSCRNLLIYLRPEAQRKVLSLFHFGLKRGGVMFLGPSENAGRHADEFATIDERWKLYRKRKDAGLPVDMRARIGASQPRAGERAEDRGSTVSLLRTYDALLDQHMPPSLLVNHRRELVHSFGGASRLLDVPDGRPSLDVLEMLAPELKMPVTGALQRVRKHGEPVVFTGIRLEGSRTRHRLTVEPVGQHEVGHMLIRLEESDAHPPQAETTAEGIDIGEVSSQQMDELESELRHTKENLQATIEELETSNEELQATNEELVASNEELQSTNEELQSVNEELYTVNAELQKKIQELTELTNDMDNLLSSTEVGTIFIDRDLTIRKFTPEIAGSFNLLQQDVGRPIESFTHNIELDDVVGAIRQVIDDEQTFEREVRDSDGNWFLLRILPYWSDGQVDGAVLTLIDVSALKRAENALFRERYLLNSLMNTLPDSVCFVDHDGRFVRVNRAFARRLGLADPSEATGRTFSEMCPGKEADEAMRSEREVMNAGTALVNRLEHTEAADGEDAWQLTTKLPLYDEDDRVVGCFAVSRDITHQKRAEDRAREAVHRRDDFLAMLSHELRNPLGAILNGARLLQQRGDDDVPVDIIGRQANHMARLLDDLLDVSRVTRNKIDLAREIFDARDVVPGAVEQVRPQAEEDGVELAVHVSDEPLCVEGDRARMQQVIVNLLSNATKYNCRGGHVWLSLEGSDGDVIIRVRDDGIGMEPPVLESVFEPFVQSERGLSRSEGGMGLGLTLVKSLVEMHGGEILAHSEGAGEGAEFVARLPRVDGRDETGDQLAEGSGPVDGVRRVLIVEDSEDHRETLSELLELFGYEVDTASDGQAALELLEKRRIPDVAVVDIGLPGIDGYELARRVRQRFGPEPRLVALTGYGSASDRQAAREAGFDAHVVKPVDSDELSGVLGRLSRGETAADE